MIVWLFKGAVL